MTNTKFIQPYFNYRRFKSHEVNVGNIKLGGSNPIRIQTMTNIAVANIENAIKQCKLMFDEGADLVRLSLVNNSDVSCLEDISKKLKLSHYNKPLIADVHFNPSLAVKAANFIEKVRINPGNYTDVSKTSASKSFSDKSYQEELEKVRDNLMPLIKVCKINGTAIRVGINHGSLAWRVVEKYGNTAEGMVEAAMEFLRIFAGEAFYNVVVSIKASDPFTMVYANRLLVNEMYNANMTFPIHIGVTEAGFGNDGVMRSFAGIGPLLTDGIGDTIRVSLTGNPVKEIPIANKLVSIFPESLKKCKCSAIKQSWPFNPFISNNEYSDDLIFPLIVIHDKTNNTLTIDNSTINICLNNFTIQNINNNDTIHDIRRNILSINKKNLLIDLSDIEIKDKTIINVYTLICDKVISGIIINNSQKELIYNLLHSCGLNNNRTIFISCPTCGRTNFDLENIALEAKEKIGNFKGLKVALMGCIVNGPGEMEDADYGIIGETNNKVSIFKKRTKLLGSISSNIAVEELKNIILQDTRFVETNSF